MLEIVEGEAVGSTGAPRLVYRAGCWSAWVGGARESRNLFSGGVASLTEE